MVLKHHKNSMVLCRNRIIVINVRSRHCRNNMLLYNCFLAQLTNVLKQQACNNYCSMLAPVRRKLLPPSLSCLCCNVVVSISTEYTNHQWHMWTTNTHSNHCLWKMWFASTNIYPFLLIYEGLRFRIGYKEVMNLAKTNLY